MATTRELFETNTFGMMAMTQAVLPQFRARKSGVIVNVTSSATLKAMPAELTRQTDVAEAVWRAANDSSGKLRYPAGADAVALAQS